MNTYNFFIPANRISNFKPYFFASLAKKFNRLQAEGMDIIRIDMGSPDLPPPDFIIEQLCQQAHLPNVHGYSANGGTPVIRQAIASYYKKRFDINLDPGNEVLALIGSKEGLFNLSQIILNPGDLVLISDPGYPVYSASTLIAGGEIYKMPLTYENNFLPDFSQIPAETARQAKLMWLNYPNNPTGAVASLEFFKSAVDFAREYEIIIAHDAPYVDICFNNYVAPSILQVPGARELTVEFNSLSKTYNMAGWRVGMAVGNAEIIKYLSTYKSQVDSSHFIPILDAAATALTSDQSWLADRNKIYETRRDIVIEGLRRVGFSVETPPAAIYVWAKLPQGINDSMTFCDQLLENTGVSTTPGLVYGEFGEGYIRISLGTATDRISEAMDRIVKWMN
ncbi:MAG: LL-diaminopimelate aminotransferase [Chloroflexi bacterium 44-23]|nr:MAG: LL-diaminopimelate aminotransferase [Chloroflexi bacterium 44-23]